MMETTGLQKFLDAQETSYHKALEEVKNGRKQSHWMWYIFPQIRGLGLSETSNYYGIRDLEEARHYLRHPVLGTRLKEISSAFLTLAGKTAHQVFGNPDELKMHSSMTLFASASQGDPVFQDVLNKYFEGAKDRNTLSILAIE